MDDDGVCDGGGGELEVLYRCFGDISVRDREVRESEGGDEVGVSVCDECVLSEFGTKEGCCGRMVKSKNGDGIVLSCYCNDTLYRTSRRSCCQSRRRERGCGFDRLAKTTSEYDVSLHRRAR